MNTLRAILTAPDVTSSIRKVLLILAAYAGAKYGLTAEAQAASLGLVASILQAWSHYDDKKIKEAA